MKEPFIRRPKVVAALTGLALAVGLAVIPAQADSSDQVQRPASTGTIGKGAAPGGPVTREQIIARAKDWVEQRVSYSQKLFWKDEATGGRYRQDCSGFVSMAWQLNSSMSTETLPLVADRIPRDQLEPGDALVNTRSHALLFGGWTDKAKGDFFYYSESNTSVPAHKTNANIHDYKIGGYYPSSYIPLRYKKLSTAPPTPPQPSAPAKPAPTTTAVPSPAPTATAPPKPKPKPKPSATATAGPKPSGTAVPRPKPTTSTAAPKPGTTAVPRPGPTSGTGVPAPERSTPAPDLPVPSAPVTPPAAPAAVAPNAVPSSPDPSPAPACAPTRRTSFRLWAFPFVIAFTF
ncbi:hypothetical protein ACWGDE_03930 [Streptomyces sp. NPDC054956]